MTRPRSATERRDAAAARRARRAEVTDPEVVMEAAATFLAVRSRSVAETRRRLRQLGYAGALSDEVVDRLIELRYLDDHAFASAWVESRDRARPRGEAALRRELGLKGVDADTIAAVLAERTERSRAGASTTGPAGQPSAGDADQEAARRLVERRRTSLMRETDPRRRRQKAYALLARNGFAPDVCREVSAMLGEDLEPVEGDV